MKLRIRRRIFSWSLVNESGITVAKMSNQKFVGPAKKISDAKGNVIFTTDILNLPAQKENWDSKKYMMYQDAKPVAAANLSFTIDPERMKAQTFTLRPPQVYKMDIETPYGIWIIQRQKNNGLTITHDGIQIGSVTPPFTFKPIFIEFTGKYEATFWAGIYMFIEYMMHEDDLIII